MNHHITREEEKAFALAKYHNLGLQHAVVTPSDTETFEPSAIRVGTAGTITAADTKGVFVTYNALVGEVLPVLCTAVKTGGTASDITRAW